MTAIIHYCNDTLRLDVGEFAKNCGGISLKEAQRKIRRIHGEHRVLFKTEEAL